MAFGEHVVDFVDGILAMAGWKAGPERRPELGIWRFLLPQPPAGKTPGLARQITECQHEGLEPAAEAFGTHKPIGRRRIRQGLAR